MVVKLDLSVIYVLICFLIIFWVSRRTLFLPLDKVLEQRRERIDSARDYLAAAETEVSKKLAEFEARINEARGEGFTVRRRLKDEAVGKETEIIEAARAKAAQKAGEAQAEIERAVEKSKQLLATESEQIGNSIAEVLLGRRA